MAAEKNRSAAVGVSGDGGGTGLEVIELWVRE